MCSGYRIKITNYPEVTQIRNKRSICQLYLQKKSHQKRLEETQEDRMKKTVKLY